VSLDGSLVRLILHSPVSFCGEVVRATNYEKIFVRERSRHPTPFQRPIRAEEVSLSTYVNARDDFLYNHLVDQLTREVGNILQADCREREKQRRQDFWFNHKSPGYYTWVLGNGTFATSAGEVVYTYQCASVIVKGIDLADCYEGLPVVRTKEPNYTDPFPNSQLFMTPLTHRLTRRGIPAPCVRPFEPKYRNLAGSWTQATPALHNARPPTTLEVAMLHQLEFQPTDFSTGGIYTTEELADMEYVQDFGRAQLDLGARLTVVSGSNYHPTDRLTAADVFPELGQLDIFKRASEQAWGIFLTWSQISSGLIGAYVFGRGLLFLYTTIMSWLTFRGQMRPCLALLYSLCPTTYLVRQQGRAASDQTTSDNLRDQILDLAFQLEHLRDRWAEERHAPTYSQAVMQRREEPDTELEPLFEASRTKPDT